MKLLLKRIALRPTYTIGRLYEITHTGKEIFLCDTLEDAVRDLNRNGIFDNGEKKVYGETAIPFGRYDVSVTRSPRFGRLLPLLHNVPEFTGVRIHAGNTAADSHGCILVGENKEKGKVLNSRATEKRLVTMLLERSENVTLEIV